MVVAIYILLMPSILPAQTYNNKSAFIFISEDKDKDFKELANSKPELLASKIQGLTPSFYAAVFNHVPALEIIKDYNADLLSQKTGDGVTPIYFAALHNNVEAIKFLAKHAASSILVKRGNGITPMFAACRNDNVEAAIALYNAYPKSDIFLISDDRGYTAIHAAAKGNAFETLTWIKSLGLDVMNVKDLKKKTPLDIAIEEGFDRSIEVLKGVKKNGLTQTDNSISVVASDKIIRLHRKWTSHRLPDAKYNLPLTFDEIKHNISSVTMGGNKQWGKPTGDPNFRLLFFTSKKNPIKSLQELAPNYQAKQFAFYDSSLQPYMQYFITVADVGPSFDERNNYEFWQRAGGSKRDLFGVESTMKLYVSASIFQKDVEALGGVVVKFVPKE